MKEWIVKEAERLWRNATSRTWIGFSLATALLYYEKLSGDQWLYAYSIFCGLNVAKDMIFKKEEL